MKSTLNSGVTNSNVIGVSVTSRMETPPVASQQTCPSSYSCPENDGCAFTGADQRNFKLSCGKDLYGGDLSYVWADSYQGCTNACAANSACIAASFTGGSGAGPCYLKNQMNGASINNNVDSEYWLDEIDAETNKNRRLLAAKRAAFFLFVFSLYRKFIDIQHDFIDTQHRFIDIQHRFIDIQHNFIDIQRDFININYVFVIKPLFRIINFNIVLLGGLIDGIKQQCYSQLNCCLIVIIIDCNFFVCHSDPYIWLPSACTYCCRSTHQLLSQSGHSWYYLDGLSSQKI
ncbi:hypothetical protein N0V86_005315 [Didymella sp. IMI 355093]|nr:hypothetical protein N0V86_005315 [Didymella sp. IMI 355093]